MFCQNDFFPCLIDLLYCNYGYAIGILQLTAVFFLLLVGILDFTGRSPVETHNRVNFTVLFMYDLILLTACRLFTT